MSRYANEPMSSKFGGSHQQIIELAYQHINHSLPLLPARAEKTNILAYKAKITYLLWYDFSKRNRMGQ
jgi:hypothetical protein